MQETPQWKAVDRDGRTHKAGGLVLRTAEGLTEALLLYRERFRDWTFPKGHCEEGETPGQAALREVTEETGVQSVIMRALPDAIYTNPATREQVITHMFLLHPVDATRLVKRGAERAAWVRLQDVPDQLSYQNLRDYFLSVLPSLQAKKT